MKSNRLLRVILISSVIGIAGGLIASFVRGHRLEQEQQRAEDKRARNFQKNEPRPKVYELAGKKTFVDPEAVKYLPEYPKAVVTDLAETTSAQGVPMKAGMFMTQDKLDDVLDWYKRELDKEGKLTVSQRWGDGAAYVGFYGPDKHMHTVAIMRSGSQTFVFLSNSDPEAFLRSKAKRPDALPAVPNVSSEVSFAFGDTGMNRQTYVANAGTLSLAQARTFYSEELPKLGWKIESTNDKDPGKVRIEAKRPGEDLSLTLTRDDKADHVAVYAHLLAHH